MRGFVKIAILSLHGLKKKAVFDLRYSENKKSRNNGSRALQRRTKRGVLSSRVALQVEPRISLLVKGGIKIWKREHLLDEIPDIVVLFH